MRKPWPQNFDLGDGTAASLLAGCVRGILPTACRALRTNGRRAAGGHVGCEPRAPKFPLGWDEVPG